ncbi:thiamine transport system ATP-binding protein [Oceanicella actignis]|uniref:Thiamine transport system ATP-binding protein n=2 Tax=Oceanicella actignis TaxID=1189325 RepID=A0A1M7T9Q4_9RHOB|nr:thiamine transport system ATP-binding protein [Oceanicella actignis]SHN67407.1 thiamine transport system ATP-binding protein [Oceanicella actignis]
MASWAGAAAMIALEDIRLRQGDFRLEGALEVPAGALCALIGPSGGGKSTILNVIAGFAPAEGRVRVAGRDVSRLPPAERPVSMLFQEHNLFPELTARANVALGASLALRPPPEALARADAALAAVGLEGLGERLPAELSGGQRQRVALARALLRDRPALLLDEPFAALGPGMRREMLGLVEELRRRRGLTVILVTHDPEEARRADLAAVAAEGRFGPAMPAEALFRAPPPALRAWLGED